MKWINLTTLFLLLILTLDAAAQNESIFIQRGHTDVISSVAFSHDDQLIASGSRDSYIKLWDSESLREIRTLKGHTDPVLSVSFSPDNRYLASASIDNTIRIWNISTGKEIRSITGEFLTHFNAVSFSPDGKFVVSCGTDGKVKVWDFQTGEEMVSMTGHQDIIKTFDISPDGQYIASGSNDNVVKVWELKSGKEIATSIDKGNIVKFLNNKTIISGNADNLVKLWDIETGKEIRSFIGHKEKIKSIAIHRNGVEFISSSHDGETILWDSKTGKKIDSFKEKNRFLEASSFSHGSDRFITAGFDRTIRLWTTSSNKLLDKTEGLGELVVSDVVYSSDGKYFATVDGWETFTLWSGITGKAIRSFTGPNRYSDINDLAFSPDSRQVITGTADDTGILWDLDSGEIIHTFEEHDDEVISVDISNDGRELLTAALDGAINIWDLKTGDLKNSFTASSDDLADALFSKDGKYVVTGSVDGVVGVWNKVDGVNIRSFANNEWEVLSVDISPNGELVGYSTNNATIDLIDVQKMSKIKSIFKKVSTISNLLFLSQNRLLVTVGYDKSFYLIDLDTENELLAFEGHSDEVLAVAAYQNGNRVLSGSTDGTSRIWDVETGNEVLQMVSSGDDWVTLTPEGYFDASTHGAKLLNVRIGNEVFSMDNFFETFYRPDLVRAKLAGEDISKLAESDIRNVTSLPPSVRFTSPENNITSNTQQITLSAEITDQGGGISAVRLFQNGKLVSGDTRGLKVVQQNETVTREFTVNLLKGKNDFRLIALSEGERIESKPAKRSISYEGAKSSTRLFTLVIGINEYKNPKYSLNYARADASAFEQRLVSGGGSIFTDVVRTTITDDKATKENIFAALNTIKTQAEPEDMFVFYYAGHGVMSSGTQSKGQFYMAPFNVTQLYGNEKLLKEKGISAGEIQEYSKNISAQKQLYLLDACQSGAATEMLAMRGAAEERAIAQLARSTGTFWLTASGSEQFATEFEKLGHGVFTYALLEGLKGEADAGAKDGKITVQELTAWINDRVPQLSEEYKGLPQYPSSFGYGQDFPIGVVKGN